MSFVRPEIFVVLLRAVMGLLLLLFAVLSRNALSADKPIAQFAVTSWAEEAGLPELAIEALIETSDGYLWVGTQEGLARFDGQTFAVFDHNNTPALQADFINVLLEDAQKSLWIGTDHSLVVRSQAGEFRRLDASDRFQLAAVTSGARAGDGSLWFAGEGGIVHVVAGKIAHSIDVRNGLPSNNVTSLVVDGDGSVWVIAQGQLYKVHDDFAEWVSPKLGLGAHQLTRLFTNKAGQLWAMAGSGTLFRLANNRFEVWWPDDAPKVKNVRAIQEDKNGTLWFGTDSGLVRTGDHQNSPAQIEQVLPGIRIEVIYEDSAGNLWIGTTGRGLVRLRAGTFTTVGGSENLTSDTALAVLVDTDDAAWVVTLNGLNRFEIDKQRSFSTLDGLTNNRVDSLALANDGGLWLGVNGNAVDHLMDGKVDRSISLRLDSPNSIVTSILEDDHNIMWIGTIAAGVVRQSPAGLLFLTTADGLPSNEIHAITQDLQGDVWIGTHDGLARVHNGTLEANPLKNEELIHINVEAIHEDMWNSLWIATANFGVLKVDRGAYEHYGIKQGLPNDEINSVVSDREGDIWLGTNHGVLEIDRSQINEFAVGRRDRFVPRHFREADGMKSSETSAGRQPSSWRGPDGRLWFPTPAGVAVVDPNHIERDTRPLRPRIENVLANDGPMVLDRTELTVPAGTSKLEIHYTAPDLSAAAETQFRYRLSAFDDDWSYVANERVARYVSVSPGLHKFFVQVRREDEDWNPDSESSVTFYVTPLFYQTHWFVALMASLCLLVLWSIHYVRMRLAHMQSAVADERRRIAGEIHDSLAQGFSAILVQIEAALVRLQRTPELAAGHLELARNVSRTGLHEARESIWNLQATSDETCELSRLIESACEPLLSNQDSKLIVVSEGRAWKPNPYSQHNVVRIIQESVSNAIHHGDAQEVRVELTCKFTQLIIRIIDNGSGFDETVRRVPRGRGYGIRNMQHRAQAMRGSFRIDSVLGVGTRVEVAIPRNKLIPLGKQRGIPPRPKGI